jgi:tRNA nucleotidyltransferase (CCA-adding enzyme)
VVVVAKRQVEVTTFRGEGAYSDSRRPDQVMFIDSVEEDLARRDFTINAIAIEPLRRTVVDPMHGRQDLESHLIRAVGDPMERLREDGLRAMRAVRFAAVLEFAVEGATLAAIPRSLASFRRVSGERVRDELLKLLAARAPSIGIGPMGETGLLDEVLPELALERHAGQAQARAIAACDAAPPDPLLRLASLLHVALADRPGGGASAGGHKNDPAASALGERVAGRLRLATDEKRRLVRLLDRHRFSLRPRDEGDLRRLARWIGPDDLEDVIALRRAIIATAPRRGAGELQRLERLGRRLSEVLASQPPLEVSQLAVDGRAIMQHLGIPPGPEVGRILQALLERVLDVPELNKERRLLQLAEEMRSGS